MRVAEWRPNEHELERAPPRLMTAVNGDMDARENSLERKRVDNKDYMCAVTMTALKDPFTQHQSHP